MIKNEQSRDTNQQIRTLQSTPTVSLPPPLLPTAPMLQTTPGISSQRLIDTNAIDITSLRGQFAWEKISTSDTYMPVLFRYVNSEQLFLEFEFLMTSFKILYT